MNTNRYTWEKGKRRERQRALWQFHNRKYVFLHFAFCLCRCIFRLLLHSASSDGEWHKNRKLHSCGIYAFGELDEGFVQLTGNRIIHFRRKKDGAVVVRLFDFSTSHLSRFRISHKTYQTEESWHDLKKLNSETFSHTSIISRREMRDKGETRAPLRSSHALEELSVLYFLLVQNYKFVACSERSIFGYFF